MSALESLDYLIGDIIELFDIDLGEYRDLAIEDTPLF
jgi:hypothetical protein